MKEVIELGIPYSKFADFHIHTGKSYDTRTSVEPHHVVEMAAMQGLSAVAVTDHDDIRPAEHAREYAAKNGYKLEVIVAAEVTTASGHVLALGIHTPIRPRLRIEDTLYQIHHQGGLAIAAHPFFGTHNTSLKEGDMRRVLEHPESDVYFDGVEIYSSGVEDIAAARGVSGRDSNPQVREFYFRNMQNISAPVGTTDSHGYVIGRGLTGYHAPSLLDAIKTRQTTALFLDQSELFRAYNIAVKVFGKEVVDSSRLRQTMEKRMNRRR